MKRPAALLLLAALAARAVAALNPLPVAHEHWFADPITWKFRADGIHCAISNAHGIAVYEAAPLSDEVTVEALFTPSAADRTGWAIASVAIVEDEHNYWHLALVQTPPEQGCAPWVELTEMRAGHWLAQHNLRQSVNEAPAGRAWPSAPRWASPSHPHNSPAAASSPQNASSPNSRSLTLSPKPTTGAP